MVESVASLDMTEQTVDYNHLAESYRHYRKPDGRIAKRIWVHTEGMQRILNVGAGMGAYEPPGPRVVALEPSRQMMAQRRDDVTTLVQGCAENLPFRNNAFQVGMAILTLHHWTDIEAGLTEMRRVTHGKVILLTWVGYGDAFWLVDYLPE